MSRLLAARRSRLWSLVPTLVFAMAHAGCGPAGDAGSEADAASEQAAAGGEVEGVAGPEAAAQPWLDGVEVGRKVDSDGAIPAPHRTDELASGEMVYVSLDVSDAPELAAVHVVFQDDAGETVAEDEKKVPADARHLYFDAGDTSGWRPGTYRVVVAVDGEPVAEKEVTVKANPQAPDEGPA